MNHKITRKTAKLSKHLRWKATRIAAIWQTEKITQRTVNGPRGENGPRVLQPASLVEREFEGASAKILMDANHAIGGYAGDMG